MIYLIEPLTVLLSTTSSSLPEWPSSRLGVGFNTQGLPGKNMACDLHMKQGESEVTKKICMRKVCMDNNTSKLICNSRHVLNTALYNFSTTQHLMNLNHGYYSYSLWEVTHQVWFLLSIYVRIMTVELWVSRFFFCVTLTWCKYLPIETFKISFDIAQNK